MLSFFGANMHVYWHKYKFCKSTSSGIMFYWNIATIRICGLYDEELEKCSDWTSAWNTESSLGETHVIWKTTVSVSGSSDPTPCADCRTSSHFQIAQRESTCSVLLGLWSACAVSYVFVRFWRSLVCVCAGSFWPRLYEHHLVRVECVADYGIGQSDSNVSEVALMVLQCYR